MQTPCRWRSFGQSTVLRRRFLWPRLMKEMTSCCSRRFASEQPRLFRGAAPGTIFLYILYLYRYFASKLEICFFHSGCLRNRNDILLKPGEISMKFRNDESSEQKQWSEPKWQRKHQSCFPRNFSHTACDCSARRASRWNYRLDAHPILLKHIISVVQFPF